MTQFFVFKNYEGDNNGEFVRGDRWSAPTIKPDEVIVEAPDDAPWPGKTGERWDGADGVRAATDAEIEARVAAIQRDAIENALAEIEVNPVMLRIVWDLIEQLRELGGVTKLPALEGIETLPEFRRKLIQHYKRREQ